MRVFGHNSTQFIIVQSRIIQVVEVLVRPEPVPMPQEAHSPTHRVKTAKIQ